MGVVPVRRARRRGSFPGVPGRDPTPRLSIRTGTDAVYVPGERPASLSATVSGTRTSSLQIGQQKPHNAKCTQRGCPCRSPERALPRQRLSPETLPCAAQAAAWGPGTPRAAFRETQAVAGGVRGPHPAGRADRKAGPRALTAHWLCPGASMGAVSCAVYVPERRWSPGPPTGGRRQPRGAWLPSWVRHLTLSAGVPGI